MHLRTIVTTIAATLLLPAAAGAEIVPQESIAGVQIGMSQAEVREVLGAPKKTKKVVNEIAGDLRQWSYGQTSVTFDSTEKDAEVMTVTTRSRSEKTEDGIGVGSTKAAVRQKVAKAKCRTEKHYDHCFVGSYTPGEVITDFSMSGGKVSRVMIGLVID